MPHLDLFPKNVNGHILRHTQQFRRRRLIVDGNENECAGWIRKLTQPAVDPTAIRKEYPCSRN
jgi:hypothetical protein